MAESFRAEHEYRTDQSTSGRTPPENEDRRHARDSQNAMCEFAKSSPPEALSSLRLSKLLVNFGLQQFARRSSKGIRLAYSRGMLSLSRRTGRRDPNREPLNR